VFQFNYPASNTANVKKNLLLKYMSSLLSRSNRRERSCRPSDPVSGHQYSIWATCQARSACRGQAARECVCKPGPHRLLPLAATCGCRLPPLVFVLKTSHGFPRLAPRLSAVRRRLRYDSAFYSTAASLQPITSKQHHASRRL
jgi:hypothetical protein